MSREFCFVKFAFLGTGRGEREYPNIWIAANMQMVGCCYFHENGNLRMLNLFDVAVVDGSMGTAVFLLDSLPVHVFCFSFTTRADVRSDAPDIEHFTFCARYLSPLYIYLRFDRWLHCTTYAACDACELYEICFFLFWLILFSREKENM